jgi:uncharacterized damage-inducible protein DinB
MIETLKTLFTRDLNRLRDEVEQYKHESNLWKIEESISNSAGNLCLHLIGNLNTYIGKEIGKTGYVRNRELEFAAKEVPRAELLKRINETIAIVNSSLDQLQPEDLTKDFPTIVFDKTTSYEYFLVHLTTHLAYHLGQVNYHRRLLDK